MMGYPFDEGPTHNPSVVEIILLRCKVPLLGIDHGLEVRIRLDLFEFNLIYGEVDYRALSR